MKNIHCKISDKHHKKFIDFKYSLKLNSLDDTLEKLIDIVEEKTSILEGNFKLKDLKGGKSEK